jgi:PAS domain S-box-containing protein
MAETPDRVPVRGDSPSAPEAPSLPRWHFVLYGLATLSLLALSSVLYLDGEISGIYSRSVAHTRVWESRQETYAHLTQLASDLIEPDLRSGSRDDAMLESERLGLAANAFREAIDRALSEAQDDDGATLHEVLVKDLSRIREISEQIHAETEALVSQYTLGKIPESRQHVLELRKARGEVRERIEELDRRARDIQGTNLDEQEAAVRALMRIGLVVAAVVGLLVVCVCLYGRRMWHQASKAARDLARSEAVLRDSEQRMRRILDSAHDAFVGMDAKGKIVEWNARAEVVFGRTRVEALGRDLVDTILPPSERDACRVEFERCVRDQDSKFLGRCVEIVALHRGGVTFPVEMAATVVRTDQSVVLSAFLRDITERKRGEEALKKSEERFDLAVRGSSDGLWDWNVAWDEFYLSPRCTELLHADDLGEVRTKDAWLSRVHPSDRAEVEAALRRHFDERVLFDVECRLRSGTGDHIWFRIRGQAVWNAQGEAVRMAGSITDITQHKQAIESLLRFQGIAEAKAQIEAQAAQLAAKTAELELARAAAESANKSKSEFLANMSHEIRTPMTAILGYSDLLANPSLSAEERRDGVQRIRQNGRHLLAILNDILDLSKIEAGKMTVERIQCSVHEIITEIAALMRPRAVEKGLDLTVEWAGRIPVAMESDPTKVRQILMNLIGNAIKFTERGGVRLAVGMAEGQGQGEAADRVRGHRHGHRDEQRADRLDLPAVHAGRPVDGAPLRGHGARPHDLAPPGGDARGQHRGRVGAREGHDVPRPDRDGLARGRRDDPADRGGRAAPEGRAAAGPRRARQRGRRMPAAEGADPARGRRARQPQDRVLAPAPRRRRGRGRRERPHRDGEGARGDGRRPALRHRPHGHADARDGRLHGHQAAARSGLQAADRRPDRARDERRPRAVPGSRLRRLRDEADRSARARPADRAPRARARSGRRRRRGPAEEGGRSREGPAEERPQARLIGPISPAGLSPRTRGR